MIEQKHCYYHLFYNNIYRKEQNVNFTALFARMKVRECQTGDLGSSVMRHCILPQLLFPTYRKEQNKMFCGSLY